MKRTAMVFALLFAAALPAMAQGRAGGGGMKWLDEPTLTAAKELGTIILAWARTDVVPQAQQWKNRLDAAMTPADLAKLDDLRRQASALKARHIAIARTMRDAWKAEDYDALKSARAEMKALGADRRAIVEQLRPIAEANRATLEAIGEDALPHIGRWTERVKTIGREWFEQNRATISPMAAMAVGRLLSHRNDLAALVEPKLRSKKAAVRFMLWDGEDFTREIDEMIQGGDLDRLQELNLE